MSRTILRAAASAIGVGLAIIIFGILGYIAGPQVEGFVFPVITATHVVWSVTRDAKELCWSTHYEKHRDLEPSYFNYRLRYNGDKIPIAAYRIEDGRRIYLSTKGFSHHPAGAVWVAHYCADMPRDIDLTNGFIVEGEGYYSSVLWDVPVRLPSFEVPAG